MSFSDQWAENEAGERFVFTVEMQRQLSEMGLPVEASYVSELPEPAPQAPPPQRSRRPDQGRSRQESSQAVQPATIQIDPLTGKYIGRLKWYDRNKGYGFIARGGGEDIFFHKTDAAVNPEEIAEGQWVLYDVEDGRKGPEATEVEEYEGDPPEA